MMRKEIETYRLVSRWQMASQRFRHARRASALIATLVLIVVMFVLVGAVLTQSRGAVQYGAQQLRTRQLYEAANAGLETIKGHVGQATYSAAGNGWLRNADNIMTNGVSNNVGGTDENIPPLASLVAAARKGEALYSKNPTLSFTLGSIDVRAYVYEVKPTLFRAISLATDNRTRQVVVRALNFRERASFARYIFFREQDLTFGNTTTDGVVHVNGGINFTEAFNSYGPTTATSGFRYYYNANSGNVNLFDYSDSDADNRDRPELRDLLNLGQGILGSSSPFMLKQSPSNDNFWRQTYNLNRIDNVSKMHFSGDKVVIQVQGRDSSGRSITTPNVTLDLPTAGLIYTDRQIQSMQGELNGRVTVAVDYGNDSNESPSSSNESIRLTGPVQYVDDQGNHPYELYQVNSNGEKLAKLNSLQDSGNAAWTQENGYSYSKNPNYLANSPGKIPPALGIIAKGRVRMTENAPFNMVFHSALVSINSSWTATYSSSQTSGNPSLSQLRKGNFRHLGAKIEQGGGGRYSRTGSFPYPGYSLSGEYHYDHRLRSFPPPHFLNEDKPAFGQTYNPIEGTINSL